MIQKLFPLILILSLSSCAYRHNGPAPIEFHHDQKNIKIDAAKVEQVEDVVVPRLIVPKDSTPKECSISERKVIYHEVQIGETIEDIATNYHQDIQELADLNGLSEPYNIDEFQILKIYQQPTSKAKQGLNDLPVSKKEKFIWPIDGKILKNFGDKTNFGHNKGVNIAANDGQEVMVSLSGKVIYSSYDATYGNMVIIKSTKEELFLTYAHLKSTELMVGDHVHPGEILGYAGSSGKVKEPQLYFSIRQGKKAINPVSYASDL